LEGKICDKCLENPYKPGEKLITVPQPEVDTNNSSYKDVSVSSYQGRIVDDFLPRKNIDQLFQTKKLETEEEILACSKEYLVERKFVEKRIHHLKLVDLKKQLRKKETALKWNERNVKTFNDYNWEEEIENNTFKNLVVKDLKKYCTQFNLGIIGKKDDLKNRVRGHWFTTKGWLCVNVFIIVSYILNPFTIVNFFKLKHLLNQLLKIVMHLA
jgi:hypothetical protein